MNEPKNGPAQAQNEIAKFSEEEKVERLERTAQDMKWLLDSEDELRTQYLHKYIAIKNASSRRKPQRPVMWLYG